MEGQAFAIEQRYKWGQEILIEIAEIARDYFSQKDYEVVQKDDKSPVTTADRAVEHKFRDTLVRNFKGDGVLGEEFEEKPSENGFRWILDPIDGTFSFIHGVPLWGTLLALEYDGRVVCGWAYMPELGELVSSCEGHGVQWLKGYDHHRVAFDSSDSALVRDEAQIPSDAVFCHTSSDYFNRNGQERLLKALESTCAATRCWSDCYALILLATGRVDMVVEPVLDFWDYAPFLSIIPEAGGVISSFEGKPLQGKTSLIATNKSLFNSALKFVDEHT